jgi:carbon monoxide dehydrogenase subunit G
MASFELTEWIARPPEELFQFLTDPQNVSRVSPNIQSLEQLTQGPVGKGTRYRETRLVNGKPARADLEVTEYEPPRTYAMRNETEGIATVYRYTFLPENNGTRVRLNAEVNGSGLKKMMAPLVAGILKKEDGDHLQRLKTLLESIVN